MKFNHLLLSLIFLVSNSIFSQNNELGVRSASDLILTPNSTLFSEDDLSDIEGSPYLNENFSFGSISSFKQKFSIRYNIYNDIFEVRQGKDSIINLNKRNTSYVISYEGLDFKSFYYLPEKKDSKTYEYFAILTNKNDSIVLLKKYNKTFTEKRKATTSYGSDKPARFSKSPIETYFIKINDSIIEIRLKAKDLYSLFPEKQIVLKNYIKKNKLKFKDEKDLIKAINYINTLE